MSDYDELAGRIDARTSGDQELYVEERRKRKVEWDGETVKSVESERDSGASLRIDDGDRIGFSYANKNELDPDWLVEQADRTREMLPADEHHTLSDADPSGEAVDRWYDSTIEESSSDRVDSVTDCVRSFLSGDDAVKNLQVTLTEHEVHTLLFRNGQPLGDEICTRFSVSTWAICDDGDDVQSGYEHQGSYRYESLELASVVERAIERGTQKLGASPPDSRTGAVVLEPQASSGLLRLLKQMTDGEAVVKGRSAWGTDSLGNQVGSDQLTLVDDPSLEDGASNRCFDAEGHEMEPVTLIEDGVYRSFLINQYVARRTGQENNGRASRTYSSRPSVGTTNFYLRPGETSLDGMRETLGDGPVVTGIQPASGLDPVSGHFSVGCSGYFVENGRIAEPFDEATITGDVEMFLGNIEAIGETLPRGYSVASPALLVSELSLGGN